MRPLVNLWKLAYFRWARRDLQIKDPTHPDLPYVVRRIAELEAQA